MADPTPTSRPTIKALDARKAEQVARVETILSHLLRGGVLLSLTIVAIGIVVLFVHKPDLLTGNLDDALKEMTFPHTVTDVFTGLVRFQGRSIIILGLIVLVSTPVLRVAVSVLVFFHQRDWIFVAITLLVLSLLILSIFLGRAEGPKATSAAESGCLRRVC